MFIRLQLKAEGDCVAAGVSFPALEMMPVVIAMRHAGFTANGALAAKLWSRFSQDQCATWMNFEPPGEGCEINRFIDWLHSDLDRDEAFS